MNIGQNKICIRCGCEFRPHKRSPYQKFCGKRCQMSAWKLKNADYCKLKDKQYYITNKERVKRNVSKWYSFNKEKIFLNRRKRYQEHRQGLLNGNERDILLNLRRVLRRRLTMAIKNNCRSGSAVCDLGCTIEFLKQYLESKFQPGMSWTNYGKWHIDHIIPLITFDLTNRDELLRAVHYTNLRPLWARENCSKGYEAFKITNEVACV